MSYEERNTWVQTFVGLVVFAYYAIATLGQLASADPADINYQRNMLITLGVSIGATIVGAIVVAIVTEIATPGDTDKRDQRDKDIARLGASIGYYVLSFGAVGSLILAMLEADDFWIANAVFFSLFIASMVESVTRIVAYRRGL